MTASPFTVPRFPRIARAAVAAWLGLALLAGATGFLARLAFPGPQLIILALIAATLVAGIAVPPLRAWIDAPPPPALLGVNAPRFLGSPVLLLAAPGPSPPPV